MDVITLFATVFGFVALAGGAAGYFKASRGDSIIKYQSTEIDLRNEKITNLEKDVSTFRAESASKDATIEELKRHNEYLQKISQGSPQLKKLTEAVENQTKLISEFMKGRMNIGDDK